MDMMLSEALNRLRKNADEWYKVRDKLKNTKTAMEIDKDYEAIEILLAQTRYDFENWSYEELVNFSEYIFRLRAGKYPTSETRRTNKAEINKRYKEKNGERAKELQREAQRRYQEKHRDKIREYNREYQRKRRERKRKENEKVITLFG